ncbi:MAG: Trk system potassium transporter TrkA [Gammaproteobacteria bacterium]|nr:Trk system potassium transporter TrkA [Gammaproteobacteria bacterium]|tara:strand:+ start:680 stop:2050 length:1371 start_codon:yes stop_codon:yes gene_type:complete
MKKIIVFGGGSVGSSVAKMLSDDGNDITLIDNDKQVLESLKEKIDLKTIHGNATFPSVQKAADTENCDMVIAVTGHDEVNLSACQISKKIFNVPRRVARLRANDYLNNEYGFDNDFFSINEVISPSLLLTDYVRNIIDHPGAFQAFQFAGGLIQVVAATVLKEGPLSGRKLSEFKKDLPNVDVKVVAIYRNKKPIFPNGDTVILPDDDVFFMATEKNMRFMSELRMSSENPHNVMIAGGGNIGSALANRLESIYKVKLIEKDKQISKNVAQKLSSTVVLNNDIADEELLKNEGIDSVDYFCAVTNDDQMNILSSKLAKEMGAKKTIAIINKSSYRNLVSKEIDVVISPEDVTISSLLASVRTSDIVSVFSLGFGDAEALELIVHGDSKTSKIVGKKISELNLPDTVNIGAVVRKNKVILANTDIKIESDDHMIIFLLDKKDISKVEKMFQVEVGFF